MSLKRIDERDIMFARMSYEVDSPRYNDYYKRNPDKKEMDDAIRQKPELCSEGTATYDEVLSPIADANFHFLSNIKHLCEGQVNQKKVEVEPSKITNILKGLALHYGACLVGITRMKEYHYYSHRGRMKEHYGEEIKEFHKYGIVFAVEMQKEMINRAPQVSTVMETSKAYVDAAIVGMQISYYLRQLGYECRNHMDGNYLVVAPLVAQDAGLGQLGRNGLLVNEEYGCRIRLGVVTTDIPLIVDEPIDFGLRAFCNKCMRCVRPCPGKAISNSTDPKEWRIIQEKCYNAWRSLGTDCGICLSACPLSQGVDGENLRQIKEDPSVIDRILDKHQENYGIRPYIKEPPKWTLPRQDSEQKE